MRSGVRARGVCAALTTRRLGERDAHGLAGVVAAARHEHDGAAIERELAGTLDARPFGVADVVEPRDQLGLAQPLAAVQGQRPCEDARNDAVALAVQPRFDDARELNVVIAEDTCRR